MICRPTRRSSGRAKSGAPLNSKSLGGLPPALLCRSQRAPTNIILSPAFFAASMVVHCSRLAPQAEQERANAAFFGVAAPIACTLSPRLLRDCCGKLRLCFAQQKAPPATAARATSTPRFSCEAVPRRLCKLSAAPPLIVAWAGSRNGDRLTHRSSGRAKSGAPLNSSIVRRLSIVQ